jgi:PAS domain S-box-containing protein
MNVREINGLVDGTADAAYALDPHGKIIAWNDAATELFGLDKAAVIGRQCSDVTHGIDECGRECNQNCSILKRAAEHHPLKNYDIKVRSSAGDKWCNASVVILDSSAHEKPCTLHIIRPADVQKRLELLLKDFVVTETSLPSVNVREILANTNSPTGVSNLTDREKEILRLLSDGKKTADIAEALFISKATANNHIQHILKKLDAHTRLEAVRRAEQAGLLRQ